MLFYYHRESIHFVVLVAKPLLQQRINLWHWLGTSSTKPVEFGIRNIIVLLVACDGVQLSFYSCDVMQSLYCFLVYFSVCLSQNKIRKAWIWEVRPHTIFCFKIYNTFPLVHICVLHALKMQHKFKWLPCFKNPKWSLWLRFVKSMCKPQQILCTRRAPVHLYTIYMKLCMFFVRSKAASLEHTSFVTRRRAL